MVNSKQPYSFNISLSVLNHLGRNLYRSFTTVLGEAISNSWDADARNVWIYIDKNKKNFVIKDDGTGMGELEFQNRFLKIGYSKRAQGEKVSPKGRPYIGRKGIGKLALLSCADKITIISKAQGKAYVGGAIDNSGLDKAIKDDLTPHEYKLEPWESNLFARRIKGHDHGTIIHFSNVREGMRGGIDTLRKTIALYFRFSLLDETFNIFLNDKKIGIEDLSDLAEKTEFLWKANELDDPFVKKKLAKVKEHKHLKFKSEFRGFIASVEKPRDLKIISTEERAGVDLFVNGRLRERGFLKHIPTARLAENYLYGQIHYDGLDDDVDRFTSSREGIVADDPKYKKFLDDFDRKVMAPVLEDWDIWRVKHRKDGDAENPRLPPKERKARALFNEVAEQFLEPTHENKKLDGWVTELGEDAQYNFGSYADCFLSENMIRRLIAERKMPLSQEAKDQIDAYKKKEDENKGKGNVSIQIRRNANKLSYLSMDELANFVDKKDPNKEACLARDAREYKPMRDALMHTALLSDDAKNKLSSVYKNIKGRVTTLLGEK
jgi:hypothetical protein